MAPSTTCGSAVSPCFHGCPAFLPRHFPPQSPPSHPLHPSLHSKQQPLPWDCSTIPKLQLQATVPSREPAYLSRVCMAPTRIVWFSFHLDCHRSVVSLSALNVSPLTQTISPMWGSFSCFSPPPTEGRSSPMNTPVFPPSSFVLPSFTWVYIFFSTGQVLLSALSRYSACTSVSESVFLMYLWREMYSTSTYSSAIFKSFTFALESIHSQLLQSLLHQIYTFSYLSQRLSTPFFFFPPSARTWVGKQGFIFGLSHSQKTNAAYSEI